MRSAKARAAAKKHKKRPPSALRPFSRRTRNVDQDGLDFMEFVKGYPCAACYFLEYREGLPARVGVSEFAHYGGNSAAKAPNLRGLPLCRQHHQDGLFSQESLKKRFGAYWGIDVEAIIGRLQAAFFAGR